MKTKKILAMTLASVMALGLGACGSDSGASDTGKGDSVSGQETAGDAGQAASGDNTLTIWAWDEAFNIKAAEAAKEIYLKDHPDVEINIVP